MKRICIFMGLMILFCIPIFSQIYVEGVDITRLDIEYCELTLQGRGLGVSGIVRIMIDYGQDRKSASTKYFVQDQTGKDMEFMGLMDALNFLYKNGWALDETYALGKEGKLAIHYILRKTTGNA